tara:strand:+ start:445 stop:936 length:492 start_codon:yes stop_codon:yes gene_type:complete
MAFDLNKVLENLKERGDALASFGKSDEDKDTDVVRVKDNTIKDVRLDKDPATEMVETGDASEAEKIYQADKGKIVEKKKEDTEDSLEKKLANIEKVIDKFGGSQTLPTGQLQGGSINDNINQRPLDMGNVQAKAAQAEYLKPSTVPNDRIALLYEDLKKYNLI